MRAETVTSDRATISLDHFEMVTLASALNEIVNGVGLERLDAEFPLGVEDIVAAHDVYQRGARAIGGDPALPSHHGAESPHVRWVRQHEAEATVEVSREFVRVLVAALEILPAELGMGLSPRMGRTPDELDAVRAELAQVSAKMSSM